MTPENVPARKRTYVLLPPSAPAPEDSPVHGPDDQATFSLSFALNEAAIGASTAVQEPAAQVAGAAEATRAESSPRRTGSLLDGLAFAVLLSVIGSTAGYYLAGQWAAGLLTWSVVGGTAGLLLGGGLLLWIRRTR